MRLYIDCDDTLVIWLDDRGQPLSGDNPMGINAGDWKPNTRLILEIERWVDAHPDATIVVWSGGGIEYAMQWGHRLLHHIPHTAMAKDTRLPFSEDLAIDDMSFLKLRCPVVDPLSWEAHHEI